MSGRSGMHGTLEDRLWAKVRKTRGCWVWLGTKTAAGYGQIFVGTRPNLKRLYSHRVAYELTNGRVPTGLFVCHHCDNRACVRPDHLFLGNPADNSADMARKGRSARGESHGRAKLCVSEVRKIRALSSSGWSQAMLAREFRVAQSTIGSIVRREYWRHV